MSEKWSKCEIMAKKIVIFIILFGAALTLFVLMPKILLFFLPFIVAYIISLIASPLTHLFEKIKLPSAVSAIAAILLVGSSLFGISAFVINKIVSEVYDFSINIPSIVQSVSDTLSNLRIAALDIFNLFPDETLPYIERAVESLQLSFSTFSSNVVEFISSTTINVISHIPGILIAVVFSILSSYFLIRDKKKVRYHLSHILGLSLTERLRAVQKYLSEAVFAYLKAQSILMSITFVEVFIGLSILGVKYSFLFAIIIAFVDAIPVFGTGTFLLPWALYHLITGNFKMTAGLAIIYAVCLVVRQFLEPKILSSQIGMHPLLTLLSMYVGYKFIGIFGMILGPVVALVSKNFFAHYRETHHPKEPAE